MRLSLTRTRSYFAALALAALSVGSSMASTIGYTTYSAWTSALTGGANTEALPFQYAPNQTLINGTLFVNGYGTYVASGIVDTLYNPNTGNPIGQGLKSAAETVSAPAGGSNATMLWLGASQTGSSQVSSQPLTITLTDINNNSQVFNLTTGGSSASFWGFTSGTAINTITITSPTGYQADLMDLFAGTFPADAPDPSATPECATILLVGGGLVFLGLKKKKFLLQAAC